MEDIIEGRVIKIESKDYYILSGSNSIVRCSLKGKFKKEFELKEEKLYVLDIVAVGDIIDYELNEDNTGVIYQIKERKNYLSRKAPRTKGASFRGERLEQIIAANVDNLVIISSVTNPKFNNRQLDRIIVAGESCRIKVKIIINKIDLDQENISSDWKRLYEEIGYDVFVTSALTGEGVDRLNSFLTGSVNLLWGQSGVGKSTLLNYLYPDLKIKIRDISESSGKGRHTTVTSVVYNVGDETYVIDTPGIREIDPYGIRKEDLSHYFIEFEPFQEDCKFNTCTHYHEPGCAVIQAVETENISIERYESYLNIADTIEKGMNF